MHLRFHSATAANACLAIQDKDERETAIRCCLLKQQVIVVMFLV